MRAKPKTDRKEALLGFLERVGRGDCTPEEAAWVAELDLEFLDNAGSSEGGSAEKKVPKPRDRMQERMKAAQKKSTLLVSLREKRREEADEWKKLIYISRYLVAMSLPYEPVKDRQIVKSARLADGRRVHLQLNAAIPGIDLPFGSDRTLLHWLLDQIARQLQQGLQMAAFEVL